MSNILLWRRLPQSASSIAHTAAVSVASCERSFSKPKLINSFLQRTMCQRMSATFGIILHRERRIRTYACWWCDRQFLNAWLNVTVVRIVKTENTCNFFLFSLFSIFILSMWCRPLVVVFGGARSRSCPSLAHDLRTPLGPGGPPGGPQRKC